jgi:phenylacetate-coenzyme A ligase PaaK-like adenylate-forming protein
VAGGFVSPGRLDYADLQRASVWFHEARGDRRAAAGELDDESWRAIPFTCKTDLRADLQPYPETGRWVARLASSGTTAEPVVSPWSEVDQQIADITALEIHAIGPPIDGARCAVIAPDSSLASAHSMCREIEISGGVARLIPPGDPEAICRTLIDDGIEVVFALPLVASRVAEYFHATRGGTPPGISLLFCGGDVLSPSRQAMLAVMWNARVINMFGCSELFGPVAGPAERGAPLVWRCGHVAVEVISATGRPASGVGERGVMVLTTLWPKASPLLRYWTDDVVEITGTASQSAGFGFDYIGRPPSLLIVDQQSAALRDIDNALLASGSCSSEWSVTQTPEVVRIEAEVLTRGAAAVGDIEETLRELIGTAVDFIAHEPGALPRVVPKFAVVRTGWIGSGPEPHRASPPR